MKFLWSVLMMVLVGGGAIAAYAGLTVRRSQGPEEIAPGVTLEIVRLAEVRDGERTAGSGRMYLVTAALDPGKLGLFVTPPDADLVGTMFTHRLKHTAGVGGGGEPGGKPVVAAVNATLFRGGSVPFRRADELARAVETTVVEGRVANYWGPSYMLGFTGDLVPEPVNFREVTAERMAGWKWGVGTQTFIVDGTTVSNPNGPAHRQTLIGVDRERKRFCMAVFEHATDYRMGEELLKRDFNYLALMDGSESSTLAVNGKAITGDWRPVATHVGVRAR